MPASVRSSRTLVSRRFADRGSARASHEPAALARPGLPAAAARTSVRRPLCEIADSIKQTWSTGRRFGRHPQPFGDAVLDAVDIRAGGRGHVDPMLNDALPLMSRRRCSGVRWTASSRRGPNPSSLCSRAAVTWLTMASRPAIRQAARARERSCPGRASRRRRRGRAVTRLRSATGAAQQNASAASERLLKRDDVVLASRNAGHCIPHDAGCSAMSAIRVVAIHRPADSQLRSSIFSSDRNCEAARRWCGRAAVGRRAGRRMARTLGRMPVESLFPRLEPLLPRVSKPIQYVGGELNARSRTGTPPTCAGPDVPRRLRGRPAQPGRHDPVRGAQRAATASSPSAPTRSGRTSRS